MAVTHAVQRAASDWRLLRTSDGSADADWLGTLTAPGAAIRAPAPHSRQSDLGVPVKVAVVVVALSSAPAPLAHQGTVTLQLVEMLDRVKNDAASDIPIGRASVSGINVGDVQTFEINGAHSWTVRITAPVGLHASMDSLEVWYRVERA